MRRVLALSVALHLRRLIMRLGLLLAKALTFSRGHVHDRCWEAGANELRTPAFPRRIGYRGETHGQRPCPTVGAWI